MLLCGHVRIIKMKFYLAAKLPLDVKIPSVRPADSSTLSEAEFHEELEKGYADGVPDRFNVWKSKS